MIDLNAVDSMPTEPFIIDHNGAISYGGLFRETADGFTVWNGSRTLEVDGTYDASVVGDKVTFTSQTYRSTLAFRPLKESDKKLLIDGGASVTSLEHLVEIINEMFSSAQ